ncbi:hypothetical protein ABIA18_000909 [Sinorhizobium fredii]
MAHIKYSPVIWWLKSERAVHACGWLPPQLQRFRLRLYQRLDKAAGAMLCRAMREETEGGSAAGESAACGDLKSPCVGIPLRCLP